jgi:hypothetical protein
MPSGGNAARRTNGETIDMSSRNRHRVVIVGSGLSGGAVATELLRQKVPFVVVEKGRFGLTPHVAARLETLPLMDPWNDPYFCPYCDNSDAFHYGRYAGLRPRVGGRSIYWRGIVLPLSPQVLASWPRSIHAALSGDGDANAGLYAEISDQLRTWVGRPLDSPRGSTEARLVTRMRDLGFRSTRATPRAIRSLGDGLWTAYSPISEIPASSVRSDSQVIEMSSNRDGVDVQFAGPHGQETLHAPAVILCAGAVENARLVSRLIPNRSAFPIVDHHAQGWVGVRASPTCIDGDREASVLLAQDARARTNLFLEIHTIDGDEVVDAWAMGEQFPGEQAQLVIDGMGRVRFAIALTDADRDVLAWQRTMLTELAHALEFRLGDWASDPQHALTFPQAVKRARILPGIAVPYYCPLGTSDHESCTLPLQGDIVSATGALRQCGEVFVAGPCLFPRAGAENPSFTSLALSRFVARQVVASLR